MQTYDPPRTCLVEEGDGVNRPKSTYEATCDAHRGPFNYSGKYRVAPNRGGRARWVAWSRVSFPTAEQLEKFRTKVALTEVESET